MLLKLKRPVFARIATFTDWPLILIDLHTKAGASTCHCCGRRAAA
jgi:hypothetical protein